MHPFEAGDATWGRRRQGLDYLQPKEEASILLVRGLLLLPLHPSLACPGLCLCASNAARIGFRGSIAFSRRQGDFFSSAAEMRTGDRIQGWATAMFLSERG